MKPQCDTIKREKKFLIVSFSCTSLSSTYDDFCGARSLEQNKEIMGEGAELTDPVLYAKTLKFKFQG